MKKIAILLLITQITNASMVPWADDAYSCAPDDDDMIRQQVMLWGTVGIGAAVAIGYLWNRFLPSQRVLHISYEPDTEALFSQLNDKEYGEKILLARLIVRALNAHSIGSLSVTQNLTRGEDQKIHVSIHLEDPILFEGTFEHLSLDQISRLLRMISLSHNNPITDIKRMLNLPLTAPLTIESLDRLLEQACREHR